MIDTIIEDVEPIFDEIDYVLKIAIDDIKIIIDEDMNHSEFQICNQCTIL